MHSTFEDEKPQRIKNERIRLGFTQQEVAEKCGVRRQQWIRYEKGLSAFDGKVFRNFVRLGADSTYILSGVKSTPEELEQAQRLLFAHVFKSDADDETFLGFINSIGNKHIQRSRRESVANLLKRDILQYIQNTDDIERLQMMKWATVLDKNDLDAVHGLVARLMMVTDEKERE